MALADDCKDLILESVIGFSGSVGSGLQHTPCGKYVVHPLGSVVVMRSLLSEKHFFFDTGGIDRKVSCLALSKDGRYLATGHELIGTTKVEALLWDLKGAIESCDHGNSSTGKNHLLHCLHQHRGKVQALDFSFDGKYLITLGGQDDNELVVWDVMSGTSICGSPAASDTTHCVKWLNQRNDRFVTCGNYHFRVWQVCTSTPKMHAVDANMGSMRRVMQCLSISEDDSNGFAGSQTGEVLQFRIDRDDIKPFDEPDDLRPSLQGYNKDRFSKGVKSVACIINPKTGKTNVIAGAGDGTIQLLNPKLQLIPSHRAKLNGAVTSVSLNAGLKTFLVGTEFSQRYQIDVATFQPELRGTCHYAEIFDVKFAGQCSDLFVTASVQDIRVWNVKEKAELLRIRVPNLCCNVIALPSSGSSIVSAWSDGKIRSFYPESGEVQFVINDAHKDEVTALAICNGDDLSSEWRLISGGKTGAVKVWKIAKSYQSMIHTMKEHRSAVNALVCNADGSHVVSASSDGSCIVWNIERGVRIHALFDPTVFKDVLFHPDESQYLTCGANSKIGYWDAYDGSAIRLIEGGDSEMTCLDMQSESEVFVSGSADKSVRVWHYDDGITLGLGLGHSGKVNAIAISPDQRRFVSVGSEGGIFIWNMSGITI